MNQQIAIEKIQPAKGNRRHGGVGDLKDLVESVRAHGVIEPIVVRPLNGKSAAGYELVAGERRWRAAKEAGLEALDAVVRKLSDEEAFEIRVIENTQRKDVHPLDEAEDFRALVKLGRTIPQIAEKVGRSPSYVAHRLKLCDLSKACWTALEENRITLRVAELLAKAPASMQDAALEDVAASDDGYEAPMGFDEAKKHLEERFLLRLENAPWDVTDAKLVAKAGACSACPKRTGQQRELFPDVKSPDLCTDAACYRSKLDALWKIRAKDARASGLTVIDGKQAEQALHRNATYARLDAEEWAGDKRVPIKKLLGKDAEIVAIAQDPDTGTHVELVKRSAVEAALKVKDKLRRVQRDGDRHAEQKRQDEKYRRQARVVTLAIGQAVDYAETAETNTLLALIVEAMVHRAGHDTHTHVCKRREIEPKKRKRAYGGDLGDFEAPLLELARGKDVETLRGLAVELALRVVSPAKWCPAKPLWKTALDDLDVDLAKVEKLVADEARAKKAAKGKKAAKKTKRGKAAH